MYSEENKSKGESGLIAKELFNEPDIELLQRCKVVDIVVNDDDFSLEQALMIYKVTQKEYEAYKNRNSSQTENDITISNSLEINQTLYPYVKGFIEVITPIVNDNNVELLTELNNIIADLKFLIQKRQHLDSLNVKIYFGPTNDVERKLIDIWAELLDKNKDTISIMDNFFEIGGHSLKAVRMTSYIMNVFNLKINMVKIYERAVLAELAEYIINLTTDASVATDYSEAKLWNDKRLEND